MKKFLSIILMAIILIGFSSVTFAESLGDSTLQMNHVYLDSRTPQQLKTAIDKFFKKKKKNYQIEFSELIVYESFKDKIELPAWYCDFRKIGSEISIGSLILLEDRKNRVDFLMLLIDADAEDADEETIRNTLNGILLTLGMTSAEIDSLFDSTGKSKTALSQDLKKYITISLGQSGLLFRIYASIPAK